MEQAAQQRAKAQVVAGMLAGQSWREATAAAGLAISRSAAYRLTQRVRMEGEGALQDQRHGHPSKLSTPVQAWLKATCRDGPCQSGRMLQAALEARFGLRVSRGHLNAMRARFGVSRRSLCAGEHHSEDSASTDWQEGAGGLILLAAVHETGLLSDLEAALPRSAALAPPRLVKSRATTRRQGLLTLLFLGAVGLRRPWDLRGYTGRGLALLTGRGRAYGYWRSERFLAQLAQAGCDQPLTDALAAWTSRLWPLRGQAPAAPCYVDGHRKAV